MATFLTYPSSTSTLTSTTRSFSRIDSVVLRVRNREAAAAWYQSSLGLQLVFEDSSTGMAVLGVGQGHSLTLWELRPGERCSFDEKACTFPIFEAVDARRQRLDLQSRGVVTSELREGPGLRCFSFWDLDGNRLDACEVVESTPA